MLAPKINDHVAQALERLLQQYKSRPLIAGMYTALIVQVQALEDMLYSLDAGRQIWDGTSTPAIGAQLDGIGEIVGIARNGLPDNEYILFIFGKIAENFSDGTIPTLLTVIQYIFQTDDIFLGEAFPAGLVFQAFNTPLPQNLWQLASSIVAGAKGSGIKLYFSGAYPTDRAFRFAGPGVTGAKNGFGDVNDPSVGGGFIGLI